MNGEGLKGCGLGRATAGGGFNNGAGLLVCFGWPRDGNCCVSDIAEPLFIWVVLIIDDLAAEAIGVVLDTGVGVAVEGGV